MTHPLSSPEKAKAGGESADPAAERRTCLEQLSHLLRNALNPIAMNVGLGLDPEISDEHRIAHLRTIEVLVRRMDALLRDLPDQAAIEAGRQALVEGDPAPPAARERGVELLSRLIANSIEAMRDGGRVTLEAERCGDEVRVAVTDAERRISALKAIVEAHGVAVRIESGPGEGSALLVTVAASAD